MSISHRDLENIRLRTQTELDAQRSRAERNALGQYATPPDLATEIVNAALGFLDPESRIRFLDPALGSGAFFSALLSTTDPNRIESAVGVEVDSRFAEAARQLWHGNGLDVIEGDFTRLAPTGSRSNLLVANPPYVRHHHVPGSQKARLRNDVAKHLGLDVSGLAGLYVYFLLLSHEWMDHGGIGAWIIPTEWMGVNYGAVVRTFLTRVVTPLRIHVFEALDVQFEDALVSSSVIIFRNSIPQRATRCSVTFGPSLARPSVSAELSVSSLGARHKWLPCLRAVSASTPQTNSVSHGGATLRDLFVVRRGIATGRNAFFVRRRREFQEIGIPGEFLKPVLPSARHLRGSIIEARPDGYPDIPEALALLDCRLPEAKLRVEYPLLASYFESEEARIARATYLSRNRDPWYAQERRPVAPFLSTYMGRGRQQECPFRFFLNRSNALATNVFLMLYPVGALRERLQVEPNNAERVRLALANTAAEWYREHGRVYGGGLHKLEPKEMASLPADRVLNAIGAVNITHAQGELSFV